MKLNIPLPIMFRGRPSRRRLSSDLYIRTMKDYQADINEISTSETLVASQAILSNTNDETVFSELRSYDGGLYRPIPSFIGEISQGKYTDLEGISIEQQIRKYISWKSDALGLSIDGNQKIWPVSALTNVQVFEKLITTVQSYRAEDVANFERIHEVQADKLLMIDGEMWIKTPPPCITVYPKIIYGAEYEIVSQIKFEYYPEHQDLDFGAVRFMLSEYNEALQYADELASLVGRGVQSDTQLQSKPSDDCPVDIRSDIDEDEIFRFALVLASNLVRREVQYKVNNPNTGTQSPSLFSGDDVSTFQSIKNETLKTNILLDERGDLIDMIPDIVRLWTSTRRVSYAGLKGLTNHNLTRWFDYTHDRVNKLIEDRPINIATFSHLKF